MQVVETAVSESGKSPINGAIKSLKTMNDKYFHKFKKSKLLSSSYNKNDKKYKSMNCVS